MSLDIKRNFKVDEREEIMNPFLEGIITAIAFLAGLCTFIYWVFGLMEKRLEVKMDLHNEKLETVANDVHNIANELREERRSKDYLYKFVLDFVERKR